jgi:uncharacterized protein YbjT (DUF2867 family)
MKPILVTGATGKTGGAVARQLLQRGIPVRAVVRSRDRRSARLAEAGADVVVADLFDYERLRTAMAGTSRAYYVAPWHPNMLQSAVAFAAAARDAGLEAIVELSQWLSSPSHPSVYTRQHWLANRMFSELPGIAHVTVNPGFFADNYLVLDILRTAVHLGLYPVPFGRSRNAPPSNEDIARVAVAALLDPQRHAGRSYRPTGPELLAGTDIAAILSRVFERRIRPVENFPEWMFLKAMTVAGYSKIERADTRWYYREHLCDTFELGSPNDDVLRVNGRNPEDFETTARRYAAHPALRRTPANFASALWDFLRVGFTVSGDMDRYERSFPKPAMRQLAQESPIWQSEHLEQPQALSIAV